MRLFYTGAQVKDASQSNPLQSLGGFVSSSVVPNNKLNSLFPNLDSNDLSEGLEDIIGVVLKNETGATVTNLRIFAELIPDNNAKFELAAVSLNSNGFMELVNDRKSLPYLGTFYDIMDVVNERVISASFDNNEMIGLWIKRIVEKTKPKTCDELYESFGDEIDTKETLKFVINYD